MIRSGSFFPRSQISIITLPWQTQTPSEIGWAHVHVWMKENVVHVRVHNFRNTFSYIKRPFSTVDHARTDALLFFIFISFRFFFAIAIHSPQDNSLLCNCSTHISNEWVLNCHGLHMNLFFFCFLWFNLCYLTSSIIHYGTRAASALLYQPICYCAPPPSTHAGSFAPLTLSQLNSKCMLMMCVNFVHLFWIWFVAQWTQFARPCEQANTDRPNKQTTSRCVEHTDRVFLKVEPLARFPFYTRESNLFCEQNTDEGTIDGRGHFVNGWFFVQIYWGINIELCCIVAQCIVAWNECKIKNLIESFHFHSFAYNKSNAMICQNEMETRPIYSLLEVRLWLRLI